MPMKQDNRMLQLKTPLGPNQLLVTGFTGQEAISRLFSFRLELISDLPNIAPSDIVGQNVTLSIELGDRSRRWFNGFVHRFVAGDLDREGRRFYRAELVPWLWFLTRTSDCRIFQEKTVPEIIEQIFSDLGFTDFEMNASGDHPKREYCVQYRETDFQFVSRLMEEEGIFYFFKHQDGKHTAVIADAKSAYGTCQESKVDFPVDFGTRAIKDHLTSWEHAWQFRTGKWAHTDFNFQTPDVNLLASEKTIVKLPGNSKFEFYDYPGEFRTKGDGTTLARWRMEAEEQEYDMVQSSSFCKSFTSGHMFTIGKHRDSSEQGKSYVLTEVTHRAVEPLAYETGWSESGPDYQNQFQCIPSTHTFRPPRSTPRPMIHGCQTAIVTGPSGEEIYTDKFGRVKVQFHWDREGKKDEKTSCWIRVSQIHAGQGWGAMDLPRIGEEVIVSFLEGDPDQPIIVGRVYHAANMPPYSLPGEQNLYGIKSNSTKGGGGYNEYVFDETKGNELIREHGQFDKDSTIEHDLREHVLHDRSRDVSNNESITIGVNRTESVGNNEQLTVGANRTESVGQNETLSVGMSRSRSVGASETIVVAMQRTHTVGVNEIIAIGAAQEITIGAFQQISVGASQEVSIGIDQSTSIGSSQNISIGQHQSITIGANLTEQVGGNRSAKVDQNDTLKVAKVLAIEAGDQIVLKTGSASIMMKKDGTIQIQGKDITVTGSGKITARASKNMVLKGQKILQN